MQIALNSVGQPYRQARSTRSEPPNREPRSVARNFRVRAADDVDDAPN